MSEIWLSHWYFWSLLGSQGRPFGVKWVMCHPRRGLGRTNWKDLADDRFWVTVLLFTYENGGYVRSGYLDNIFGRFGALRGAPGVKVG